MTTQENLKILRNSKTLIYESTLDACHNEDLLKEIIADEGLFSAMIAIPEGMKNIANSPDAMRVIIENKKALRTIMKNTEALSTIEHSVIAYKTFLNSDKLKHFTPNKNTINNQKCFFGPKGDGFLSDAIDSKNEDDYILIVSGYSTEPKAIRVVNSLVTNGIHREYADGYVYNSRRDIYFYPMEMAETEDDPYIPIMKFCQYGFTDTCTVNYFVI